MGFLLGAFGKQMAGTRYRSLQARMLRISSKVRTIHRRMETMQKCLEREKKSMLNAATLENQMAKQMYQQQLGSIQSGILASMQLGDAKSMSSEQANYFNVQNSLQSQTIQNQISQADIALAQAKERIEREYEQYNESLVEPLKDEEEDLTSEKEMLEGQVALAKEDYEACKKMEQADIKMLTPNYTGQA